MKKPRIAGRASPLQRKFLSNHGQARDAARWEESLRAGIKDRTLPGIAQRGQTVYRTPMSLLLRIAALLTLLIMGAAAACQVSSGSWPHTLATVQQAGWDGELNLAHRGSSEYNVHYTYKVDGKTYTNSRISFGNGRSVMYIINTKEERQPREEDQVTVSYLSFYPALSVLLPGPAPTLWIWGVVSVLLAVLFWMVARVLREPVI